MVATLAGMLFMSGASLKWLATLAAAVVAAIPIIWTDVLHEYQRARLLALLTRARILERAATRSSRPRPP